MDPSIYHHNCFTTSLQILVLTTTNSFIEYNDYEGNKKQTALRLCSLINAKITF